MAQGGSRLNQIFAGSGMKNPPKSVASDIPINSDTTQSTTGANRESDGSDGVKSRINKTSASKNDNRISTILSDVNDDTELFADPPISSIDYIDNPDLSIESSSSPLQEFESDVTVEKEMEDLLNKILRNSANDNSGHGHGHGQGINSTDSSTLFNTDISEMFKNIQNMPGMSGMTGMPSMPGMNPQAQQVEKTPLELAKAKLFRSGYVIIRFIIISILVMQNIEGFGSGYGYIFPENSKLWIHFLWIEVILGIFYLTLSYLSIFPNHTILSFDISSFGYANSILTSYGLIKSFFTDFCFLVVLLGFLFYFGSLN